MKNLKQQMLIIFVIMLFNFHFKFYLIVIGYLIIFLKKMLKIKTEQFYNKMNNLKMYNCLNLNIDEKIALTYNLDKNNKNNCKILQSHAKSKIERLFFSKLANCENKKQIDHLIYIFQNHYFRNDMEVFTNVIFIEIILFVLTFLFKEKINLSIVYIINLILLVFCLYSEKELNRINTKNNKCSHFIFFYESLTNLSPCLALKTTIEKFELNSSVYSNIYESIKNNKKIDALRNFDDHDLINLIFKFCLKNNIDDYSKLNLYYKKYLEQENYFFYILKKTYLVIVDLLLIYVVVIL